MFNPGTMVFVDDEDVTWFNIDVALNSRVSAGVGLEESDPCIVIGIINPDVLPTWISRSGFPCYLLLSRLGVVYARQDGLTRIEDGV